MIWAGLVAATVALAGTLTAYQLPQSRLAPALGIALWAAMIGLRAAIGLGAALSLLVLLPATAGFHEATSWCLHAVIPLFSTHLGMNGHRLGEMATLVPAAGLFCSLALGGLALWRTGRGLGAWMHANALGVGPGQSFLVGGDEVIVAAAGLRHPRVVVSAGALAALDDDELEAGISHERAHIERRHSYLSLFVALLHPLGRGLPVGGRAMANLQFHLERDADERAVEARGDPLALAAAICKAGRSALAPTPFLAGLSGHSVSARVRLLLDRDSAHPSPTATLLAASALASFVLCLGALLALDADLAERAFSYLAGAAAIPFCRT